jgi:colanic acid biosynthesis glycosyl transferase WcaI
MRILIIVFHFQPESTGSGKYTSEMAAYLSQAGHQVRVITTPPYFPDGRIGAGHHGRGYRRETWSGVQIYRCSVWVPREPSGLKPVLHLLSFALSSFPILLRQLLWSPQVVLCVAPPLFLAPFARFVARLCGAKAWLHIQAFEPRMTGSGNLLTRWAARAENRLLRSFERISTVSSRMLVRLEDRGISPEKTCLLPNWVDINAIYPLPDGGEAARRELGFPVDKVIVLYAGDMQAEPELGILVEAAWGVRKNSAIHFVLCGQGDARAYLERAARELRNVQFLPPQPPEKLNRLLNAADIHILPQEASANDLVIPSRLLGMLASGKVVIATADPSSEIGKVVEQVGVLVPPGNQPALCEAILELGISSQERTRLGMKGRAYVCKHWSTEHVLGDFERRLREFVAGDSKDVRDSLLIKR